jgi:hypothetical protein
VSTNNTGSQLAYILSSGEGNERVLFDPAVKTYLTELQQERDMEAAMEAEAAADAAAEAAAAAATGDDSSSNGAGDASSSGSSEGADVSDTWDDAALMKRIKALREAERGQVSRQQQLPASSLVTAAVARPQSCDSSSSRAVACKGLLPAALSNPSSRSSPFPAGQCHVRNFCMRLLLPTSSLPPPPPLLPP